MVFRFIVGCCVDFGNPKAATQLSKYCDGTHHEVNERYRLLTTLTKSSCHSVCCSRMGTKELRWLFLAVLAVAFFLSFISEPISLGVSQQWTNGKYSFAAGTRPIALAFSFVIVALYMLLMFAPPANLGAPLPGVFRRFITFLLDFILAMMVIGPVMGILPALTEWGRTGTFRWNFERTTQVSGDGWLTSAGLILCFAALIFYFAFPLTRHRPSPGACIAGYQIVPDDGVTITPKAAVLRTLLGFIAACAAYLAPFIERDRKRGKFWLDKVFGTRAVILR
jgi:uncharacterized RDD family membrane protein YckC